MNSNKANHQLHIKPIKPLSDCSPRMLALRTGVRGGDHYPMSPTCDNECMAACKATGHDEGWCEAVRCEEWPSY